MKKIGFIGVGVMGKSMVRNLILVNYIFNYIFNFTYRYI